MNVLNFERSSRRAMLAKLVKCIKSVEDASSVGKCSVVFSCGKRVSVLGLVVFKRVLFINVSRCGAVVKREEIQY